jgi:hypothetical protein
MKMEFLDKLHILFYFLVFGDFRSTLREEELTSFLRSWGQEMIKKCEAIRASVHPLNLPIAYTRIVPTLSGAEQSSDSSYRDRPGCP